MRLPNGYGGIRKLSGKRRKPYQVVVTIGWESDGVKARQKQKVIGSYATRAEALMALGEWNKDPVILQKATLAEVWEKWLPTQEQFSKSKLSSIKMAHRHIEHLLNTPISAITSVELQNIIDTLKSNSYQLQHISAYRSVFDYAYTHGYVSENITSKITTTVNAKKPTVNIFTLDEIAQLPEQYKLFFYTGMRVNEMLSVTADDIDREHEVILVRGSKTESALRHIPIHPQIRDMVLATNDRLWQWQRRYPTLLRDFRQHNSNHKIHDMRKTFATACYLSGIDDVITKRLMGHHVSDITHSTYIKNDDIELLREGINKLDYSYLN